MVAEEQYLLSWGHKREDRFGFQKNISSTWSAKYKGKFGCKIPCQC
jgi:hypothetical protein